PLLPRRGHAVSAAGPAAEGAGAAMAVSHEPYVATPRYILRHLGRDHPRMAEMPERLKKGREALSVMETHLAQTGDFFVGHRYTVADIALYAYTHRADEADLDLQPYPAVRAWLERVASRPGHIPMLPG